MNSDTVFKNDPIRDSFRRYGLSERYPSVHIFHRPKFRLDEHTHDIWHLMYVIEGELHIETDNREFTVGVGCAHFQPSEYPHALSSEGGYRQLGINLVPDERLCAAIPRPITIPLPEMMAVVQQISRLDDSVPYFDEQLTAYCDLILYAALNAAGRHAEHPLKKKILDAVESRLDGEFSLEALAGELYISSSYLGRLSRRFFGMGVLALRNRKRFDRACGLLTDSTMTIREVAEAVGFSEASNFAAFFKRYAGCSPAAFRGRYYE